MVSLGLILLVLMFAAAGVWVWINFGGGYRRSLDHRLNPDATPDRSRHAAVAIFSPGRDEAEHLPTVLPELCEQDHPQTNVVFIDDASTDQTPKIAANLQHSYANLTVVRNEAEPPPGWMGKCWAIHQGVEEIRKAESGVRKEALINQEENPQPTSHLALPTSHFDWFCFTDADIHWDPRLLSAALALADEHDADLIGLAPRLVFGSPMEAIVQLQLVLALGLMIPFEKAMEPQTPYALTGGAFILVRRSFYDQIGGHEAVKGEMVEDLKLGQALKQAGAKHRVALADDLLWCRMYDGWSDMWEGLTKNAYAGVEHTWWRAITLSLGVFVCNVLPPLAAMVSLGMTIATRHVVWLLMFVLSMAAWLLAARALNTTRRMMHLPRWYAWTMPVGSAAYLTIIAASVWRYYRGGSVWKGRRYGPGAAS